ncbi:MAG: putative DNA-binding transcriptional regulator YafY [Crocinitomicaceae bacterium]
MCGELSCRKLAEEFEVKPKTIQHDITHMRDQMGIDLHYNQQLHGYEIVGELQNFPLVDLQVEDLAVLFLARSAMGGGFRELNLQSHSSQPLRGCRSNLKER